ncbi:hypothetical protein BZA70DRAFT_268878 [Myxozyma melibiosi]|uniref:SPX domain-containing protein n=1 Tax=Myxozyma melibiosi TaxID=54550 RepID=A0ABR1F276_9ASCO
MRYGYVLAQYSVPEWKAFAVDYDEFKSLIKNTVVPGSGSSGEEVIFSALNEQIERVNIFVRSKAGELERRIRNCNKAIEDISKQDATRTYPVSNAQRQRPILKIEYEMDSIYRELQHLARFVSAHKIGISSSNHLIYIPPLTSPPAFRKLVKAFNKRSNTSSLSSRFTALIENPKSFAKRDFAPLIVELSFLYDSIRRYFQSSLRFFTQSHTAMADLDFETSSFSAPNSASFWVHEDNVVELEIYLLKYLSIMPNESIFRRNLLNSNEYGVQSDTRIVFLNSANALENINSPKKFHDELSKIVADVDADGNEAVLCTPGGATLTGKRKYIESIVNSSASPQEMQQLDSIGKSVVAWVKKNYAKPSVVVGANRIRYEQIGTNGTTVWASLDNDVKYRRVESATGWTDLGTSRDFSSFPYSVLELRWQGPEPKWIHDLKASHMVYEVPGFNYFSHATSALGLSDQQPSWLRLVYEDIHKVPKQKVVRPRLNGRNSSSKTATLTQASSSSSSSSGTTVEGNSSVETPLENMPVTVANAASAGFRRSSVSRASQRASSIISSIFSTRPSSPPPFPKRNGPPPDVAEIARLGRGRRGRRGGKATPNRPLQIVHPENDQNRYWNEFDHPEDDESTFFIDVDNSTSDSGTLNKLSDWSNSIWSRVSQKVHSISDMVDVSPSRRAAQDAEREGLLQNNDHDLDNAAALSLNRPGNDVESGNRPMSRLGFQDAESFDRALTMFYAVSFSISLVLVGILDGIIFGGQHSAAPVYVSLLASIGLVFAEMIALSGVTAFLWRRNVPGALHQILVFLAMLTIVCGGVGGVLVILF